MHRPIRRRLEDLEARQPPPADIREFGRLVETLSQKQRARLRVVLEDLADGRITRDLAAQRALLAASVPAGPTAP